MTQEQGGERERESERESESKITIKGGKNSQREENAKYVTEITICSDSQ
jgi:hypothetical protein